MKPIREDSVMNQGKLKKRVALITGGASGFGLACARALLGSGAKVAIGDVDESRLRAAEKEIGNSNLLALKMDVSSIADVRAAVSRCRDAFGRLDTLVNSAGIIRISAFEEIAEEEWDRILAVDLKGAFLCCQAAAPLLRASGRGRIVNIASDAAKIGFPYIAHYSAAKAGLIGLSRSIAAELAPHNVTVNCLCPVATPDTGMGQWCVRWKSKRTGHSREQIKTQVAMGNPIRRNCETADVVNALMFFVSDAAGFLTGQALDVDGGAINLRSIPGTSDET